MAGAGPRAVRLLSPFADDEVPVVQARLSCGQAINDGGLKLSDEDLLKHLRGADADAAEALINTYGARAYRLAVRITGKCGRRCGKLRSRVAPRHPELA